jgi:hypothetical protein
MWEAGLFGGKYLPCFDLRNSIFTLPLFLNTYFYELESQKDLTFISNISFEKHFILLKSCSKIESYATK